MLFTWIWVVHSAVSPKTFAQAEHNLPYSPQDASPRCRCRGCLITNSKLSRSLPQHQDELNYNSGKNAGRQFGRSSKVFVAVSLRYLLTAPICMSLILSPESFAPHLASLRRTDLCGVANSRHGGRFIMKVIYILRFFRRAEDFLRKQE